jgi:DNA-binding response OmpR family regulator
MTSPHDKEQEEEFAATLASLISVLPTDHFCDHCLSQIRESIAQIVNARHRSGGRGRSFRQPWKGVKVSPQEYKLLEILYRDKERAIPSSNLVNLVYGPLDTPADAPHALRQMILRLRGKLEGTPWTIATRGRRGYQLVQVGDYLEPEPEENLEDDPWSLI